MAERVESKHMPVTAEMYRLDKKFETREKKEGKIEMRVWTDERRRSVRETCERINYQKEGVNEIMEETVEKR